MVSRVRKGLAASQMTLNPEPMRAPSPACVVLKALTLAKALRLELGPTLGTDPSTMVFAGDRVLAARWAISQREGQAKWTTDTLTNWLQLGATTAAYVIGVTMQKIKYFGGWAMESSVRGARLHRPNSAAVSGSMAPLWLDDPLGADPIRRAAVAREVERQGEQVAAASGSVDEDNSVIFPSSSNTVHAL
eukprot:jgi/Tetstr1/438944/TSEL_027439.t1